MLAMYVILFFMYSFIGWAMEVFCSIYQYHKFINRGFLIGPYCPIYGFGCLALTILLQRYTEDFLILFVMSIVICSILEYFTSYLMEKIFHARWWDYSNKKFNLNGRICLETMIPFGILGSLVIYYVNPFFKGIINSMPMVLTNVIAIVLFVIFFIDNIISLKVITNLKMATNATKKDSTEEITKKVKKTLQDKNLFTKRLVDAFPNFKVLTRKTLEKISKTKKEIKQKQKTIKKMEKEIIKDKKKIDKLK